MTDETHAIPPFPALRYSIALLVLMVVGAGVAALVLMMLGWEAQAWPAIGGLVVCTLGGLVALELVRRGARHSMERLTVMCMAGTAARLGVTLVGGCGLVFLGGMEVRATASWMLVWYVLLLVIEVKLLAGYLGSMALPRGVKAIELAEGR